MRKTIFLFILILGFQSVYSNLLHDIMDGKYRPKGFETPKSMIDGDFYSTKFNDKAIIKYNYKTGTFVDTIFSISQIKNCPIKSISGYEFSPNENKLLVYTNVKYRYRRTFTADYYVFDVKRKELTPLSEMGGSQEVPLFSPDSRYIAFARANNLYMKKLDFNTEIAITKDGEIGKIINGTPDWVYEEEFEATRHFCWSPDSKLLAFTKFDESEISEFSFQLFKNKQNENDELNLYPSYMKFKYPKENHETFISNIYTYI